MNPKILSLICRATVEFMMNYSRSYQCYIFLMFHFVLVYLFTFARFIFLLVNLSFVGEKYEMRCAIWYRTLKNDVRMVGQNAVLTSKNAFEWLGQKSVSVSPFDGIQTRISHLPICMACK